MHCPAKGRAGGSRSRLQVLLACSCALVVVIYAPRRRRTAVLNHSGQGDGDGSSSGAGDSGSGGGGTAGGTGGGSSGGDCKLDRLIGEGPFAQSCHLIKDVCVDQVRALLPVCLPVLLFNSWRGRRSPPPPVARPPLPPAQHCLFCMFCMCSAPPSCTVASTTQRPGDTRRPCPCWSPPSATATTSLCTRRR